MQTLKRETKGGETLSYILIVFVEQILRLHSFRFNECTHVYSEEGGREDEYPKDAQARPMYTYCAFDIIDIGIQLSNL